MEMKKSTSDAIVKSQIELCEAELNRQTTLLGLDHPDLAKPLGMLGLLHQHMAKNPERAIAYHEEAKRVLCLALQNVRKEEGQECY